MLFLYDLGIQLYHFLILLASLKNKKAAAWIEGRKNLLHRIDHQINTEKTHIWFHFASLGEFEQGRPVLEEIKSKYPGKSIIITFFSPSGYEIRKDYKLADHVFYLPLDTRRNAKEFIRLVKPSIAVFTKYEYWYHYFEELHKNKVPLFIVSGIFREDQPFFRWYGGLHRKMLFMVSHFFVQNETSKTLLTNLGLSNVSVTGDTRFDRVIKNISQVSVIPSVEEFCAGSRVFIAGSTWHKDEMLITKLADQYQEWKFIIAPHEVNPERIVEVEKLFLHSVRYSRMILPREQNEDQSVLINNQVLIIDNIGMLSSLYQYGDIAYIGGGFGGGIHNTLEAAAFGLPVIFGPKYDKFREAKDLIACGAAASISEKDDLVRAFERFKADKNASAIAKKYVEAKRGATEKILKVINV